MIGWVGAVMGWAWGGDGVMIGWGWRWGGAEMG